MSLYVITGNMSALYCTVPVWRTYVRRPGEHKEERADSQGEYAMHADQVGVRIDVPRARVKGIGRGMWIGVVREENRTNQWHCELLAVSWIRTIQGHYRVCYTLSMSNILMTLYLESAFPSSCQAWFIQ